MSRSTVIRWFHQGHIPGRQLPTGTILLSEPSSPLGVRAAVYARVEDEQSNDLAAQVSIAEELCQRNGWSVARIETETAPGDLSNRPALERLLFEVVNEWDILVTGSEKHLAEDGLRFVKEHVRVLNKRLVCVDGLVDSVGAVKRNHSGETTEVTR